MRPPCVLLLLAFAVPPVGVAAHAELSDNVATDGRHEVRRHLRIRAHDADDDERTGFQAEKIISREVLNNAAKLIKIPIAGTSRNGALDKEILNLKIFDLLVEASKKRKRSAEQEPTAAEVFEAYKKTKNGLHRGQPFDSFADLNKMSKNWVKLFGRANNFFLSKGYDPKTIFEVYELHSAGDELFRPSTLYYWIMYLKEYNKLKGTKISMLDILREYYHFTDLFVAANRYRSNIMPQLAIELLHHSIRYNVHPDTVSTWLGIKKTTKRKSLTYKFDKAYRAYYDKKAKKSNDKVSSKDEVFIDGMDIVVDTSKPEGEMVPTLESMLKEAANADLDTHK